MAWGLFSRCPIRTDSLLYQLLAHLRQSVGDALLETADGIHAGPPDLDAFEVAGEREFGLDQ